MKETCEFFDKIPHFERTLEACCPYQCGAVFSPVLAGRDEWGYMYCLECGQYILWRSKRWIAEEHLESEEEEDMARKAHKKKERKTNPRRKRSRRWEQDDTDRRRR